MHFRTTTTGCFSDKDHNVARCCFQMSNRDILWRQDGQPLWFIRNFIVKVCLFLLTEGSLQLWCTSKQQLLAVLAIKTIMLPFVAFKWATVIYVHTVMRRWTGIMDSKKLYPGKKTCIIFKCLFDLGFKNLGDNDHNVARCCFQMSNRNTLWPKVDSH